MNLSNLSLVYDAATKAGFTGASLVTAIAVAAAESGFDPKAVGDVALVDAKWGPSIGLWQIRSLQPSSLYLEPVRDGSKLSDPYYNARAAFQISKSGANFSPWTAFTNGAYKEFLNLVSVAENNPVAVATGGGTILVLLVLAFLFFRK